MKITKDQKKEIIRRYARYKRITERLKKDSLESMATEYNTSISNIFYIANKKHPKTKTKIKSEEKTYGHDNNRNG